MDALDTSNTSEIEIKQTASANGDFELPSFVFGRRDNCSCPAKVAEPVLMPFGILTRLVPGNHVLDGDPDRHMGRAIWRVKRGWLRTCLEISGC